MRLLRGAALFGIGKKIFDEARKPENQRKIKDAAGQLKSRQAGRKRPGA